MKKTIPLYFILNYSLERITTDHIFNPILCPNFVQITMPASKTFSMVTREYKINIRKTSGLYCNLYLQRTIAILKVVVVAYNMTKR